jgi:hypothetical protein
MKKAEIIITGKFGSKFQQNFAETSLFNLLKSWKQFLDSSSINNKILVEINGDNINNLDWFNFKTPKGR